MKLMKQKATILTPENGQEALRRIEYAGRNCYRSHDRISEGSAAQFVRGL